MVLNRNLPTRLLPLLVLCIACLSSSIFPSTANAQYPYSTNYRNASNDLVWTQAAYAPDRILGRDIMLPDPDDRELTAPSPLQGPMDLFVDKQDKIYVADTGNNRIVIFHANGKFEKNITVEQSMLSKPQGVYVDESGHLYIADTGNRRIVKVDQDGNVLQEFYQPESRFLPKNFRFEPIKVAVDKRGFLYVVSSGTYQGLIMLDSDGQFQRFFGANDAPFSILDALKRFLYTDEMFERQLSKLPPAINNIAIDEQGFIYTVSYAPEMTSKQVKKLNYAGLNFLGSRTQYSSSGGSFGEVRFKRLGGQNPNLSDIAVDSLGNFTVVDSQLKVISQYDAFGNLLFFWSGEGNQSTPQLGNPQSPIAIDVNSRGEMFILDNHANVIQSFRLTEFGELVHQANALTIEGQYEEAKPYWEQVLQLNAYYTPALMGLAQAAYREGDYQSAQQLFLQAGNQEGYSDSFWQIRLKWFQNYFSILMNVIIAFLVLFFLYHFVSKKYGFKPKLRLRIKHPLWLQLRHALYLLRHPIDGFSALRYEKKGSYLSAIIIFGLVYVALCIQRMFTSFTFSTDAIRYVSIATVFIQLGVVWFSWVLCNYLVSSIMRGEGRFKDVFMGSAYALMPLIVVGIPLTIVSNVMTESESSIYSFLYNGMFVWILLLTFWKVQTLHNYSVGETVLNIVLSCFTMVGLAVLGFLFIGLFNELRDFAYSIFQEVSVR